MTRLTYFAAILAMMAAALATPSAQASPQQIDVAYWAFNNDPLPGGGFGYLADPDDFPIGADFGEQAGSATLTVNGGITADTIVNGNGDTVYQWIQSFAGSTVNAQFGELSGGSLSIQGGTNNANNGAYIEIAFDGTNLTDVEFSFAGRRTSTGFSNVNIDVYDGTTLLGNLVTGLNLTTSTTLGLYEYSTALLDNVSDARIRLTLDGATSATGNVRLDNMYIQAIPEPATMALLGLGGLVMLARRQS